MGSTGCGWSIVLEAAPGAGDSENRLKLLPNPCPAAAGCFGKRGHGWPRVNTLQHSSKLFIRARGSAVLRAAARPADAQVVVQEPAKTGCAPRRSLPGSPPARQHVEIADPPAFAQDLIAEAPVAPREFESDTFEEDVQSQPPMGRSAVQFHFDRDRHEMTLRLRYTTAIVSTFAILVALGMAYVLGRRIAGGPQTALASPTTEELLNAPAQPSVIDVGKTSEHGVQPSSTRVPSSDLLRSRDIESKAIPAAPLGGATDGHRVVHTNYIIVQSYPTQKSAMEARDFLIQAGVPCTAEKAPAGYTADPNWYSVITTTGYQHPRGPEGEAYLRSIEKMGEKFAGTSHFKRFEPHWYSWR